MLRTPAPIRAPVPGCSWPLCALSGCMDGAVCGWADVEGAMPGGGMGGGPGGGGGIPGGSVGDGTGWLTAPPDGDPGCGLVLGGVDGPIGGGAGSDGGTCAEA